MTWITINAMKREIFYSMGILLNRVGLYLLKRPGEFPPTQDSIVGSSGVFFLNFPNQLNTQEKSTRPVTF